MMKTIARKLSEYAFSFQYNDMPPEVVHEAKRRLIDSLGCAFGAYRSRPGSIVRGIGKEIMGKNSATLFGTNVRTTPDFATFANGILIRYLDYNDTYLSTEPAHPSDNISAVLAVSEAESLDGRELITAITLGYEVQCRLCDVASLRTRGWDHVAYVSISSAIVASKLMKLSKEKIKHAICLSIVPNIPLRQTRVGRLSIWKGCAAANAARNGVFAAILARKGMKGPSDVFEGEKGFFAQVTGPFELDIDDFGGRTGGFKILDTSIKHYPAEYHSQTGIEAALELRKKIRIEEIEEINIKTYDTCIEIIAGDMEKWDPKTRETADHSLPYCVAVALYDGEVGLEQFSEERIRRPEIRALINKVKVLRSPDYTKSYPKAFPCQVEIKSKSGESYSMTINHPKGHPKKPLTDRDVEEKFKGLCHNCINSKRARDILDRIWYCETIKDIGGFMELLKVG